MKIDFDKKMYIGCMPVWAHPARLTDQSHCEIWECPGCNKNMWVSEKKRAYQATHKDVEIYCLHCLAHAAYLQGFTPELQDISEIN